MKEFEESSAVKVAVRLRPMNESEKKMGITPAISASTENKTVTVIKGHGMTRSMFAFNDVYTSFATQKEVFDGSISGVINDAMRGYTSTILAYGQTGTGKTHTMEGDISDPSMYGVIPRSIGHIFKALEQPKFTSGSVTCSYLEIYNEELCDLFADSLNHEKLEIYNGKEGTCCKNLIEREVQKPEDVLALIRKADQSRRIGETKMNKQSSRSHCIFTVHVYSRSESFDGNPTDYHGRLHMVDLAGSENSKADTERRSTSNGSARERERKNINTSLLTLGRVISAVKKMSQGKKNIRIPYRDSKLTRVLQDSLGGRSKTVIIATVSPSEMAVAESTSTLNYAQAANGIINKPIASSQQVSQHRAHMGFDGNGERQSVEQWYELECKLKYMEAQVEEAQNAMARKNQQQRLLLDKVEEAESQVLLKEKALHQSIERIESLDTALSAEREKTESLSHELKLTEASLLRTSAVLEATQQTEQNLSSEAAALIKAVQKSIYDGDEMYQMLLNERQNEVARKAATTKFEDVIFTIIDNLNHKMEDVLGTEQAFCRGLVQSTEEEAKAGKQALIDTVDALKDVNLNVKNLAFTMKNLSLKEDGIVPILDDFTSNIGSELSNGTVAIERCNTRIKSATDATCESLHLYSDKMRERTAKTENTISTALEMMMLKLDSSKTSIIQSTNALLKSSSEIALERSKAREELHEAMADVTKVSMLAMKNVGSCSVRQQNRMNESMTEFIDGLKHIDEANEDLQHQMSFVHTKADSQLGIISSQQSLLTSQQVAFTEAHKRQKEFHSKTVKEVMRGVQQLLHNEFSKLDQSLDTSFSSFAVDNHEITDLNSSIDHSTRDIVSEVERTNNSLTNHVDELSKSDKAFLAESKRANQVLAEIQDKAKNHSKFIYESRHSADERFDDLSSFDKPLQGVLNKFEKEQDDVINFIKNDTANFAADRFNKIAEDTNAISNEVCENLIPGVVRDVEGTAKECDDVFSNLTNNLANIQATTNKGQMDITDRVQQICQTADTLQHSVTTKCSKFHGSIVAVRSKEIENSCVGTVRDAADHVNSTKSAISSMLALSKDLGSGTSAFSNDTIHAHDVTKPLDTRREVEYSENLSSTPSEHLIIAALDQQQLEVSQDENAMMRLQADLIDYRDDAPSDPLKAGPASPLSPRNSPRLHSKQAFRF